MAAHDPGGITRKPHALQRNSSSRDFTPSHLTHPHHASPHLTSSIHPSLHPPAHPSIHSLTSIPTNHRRFFRERSYHQNKQEEEHGLTKFCDFPFSFYTAKRCEIIATIPMKRKPRERTKTPSMSVRGAYLSTHHHHHQAPRPPLIPSNDYSD